MKKEPGVRNPALRGTKKRKKGKDNYVTQNQLSRVLSIQDGKRVVHQYQLNSTNATTAIYSKILGSNITKGTNQGQRSGDSVSLTHHTTNFKFENIDAFFSMKIRIVVAEIARPLENLTNELFCPQTTANTPVNFDGSAGVVADRALYDMMPLNPDKFVKIYYDKVHEVAIDGCETAIGYQRNFKNVSVKIPLGGKRLTYTTNADNDYAIFPQVKIFWFVCHPTGAESTPIKTSYLGKTHFMC